MMLAMTEVKDVTGNTQQGGGGSSERHLDDQVKSSSFTNTGNECLEVCFSNDQLKSPMSRRSSQQYSRGNHGLMEREV